MNHQTEGKTFLPVFLTALILSIAFSLFLSARLYPEDKSAGKTIRIRLQFLHNREYPASASRPSPPAFSAMVRFSVARLFNRKYYPYARIVERNKADYAFTVEIAEEPGKYTITTSLAAQDNQSPGHNKIISTIPYLSYASGISAAPSLVPAIAGDIFYLFAQAGDFRFTALSSPPSLRAVLHTNALQQITGWTGKELQPLDISNYREGLLLTMAGGFLTLGNSLQITGGTVRDISYQQENRISFLPLTASSDLLGNITVISQNADSFEIIKFDRTKRIILKNELKQQGAGNFLYAGFYSGGFALIDQSTGADKKISFYTQTAIVSGYIKSETRAVPPAVKTYPLHSSYISAMASDYGGNLWLYDSMEKRIRIVNQQGSEISSVKPIIPPSLLLFPQLLKICSDGSFMLGGSGVLVKFDSAGIPIWTLREYQLNGTRALPAFFRIACSEKDLSFFLLDMQSRQILKFREYSGQSGRNNIRIAKSDKAVLFDTELPPSDKKKLARITEKAGRYYEDELEPHFAETFYNRSLKLFRGIRKKDPVDPDAPLKIKELIRARNRTADYPVPDHTIAVSLSPDTFYTSARLYYREKDALKLRISNLTGDLVDNISLRMYIPGFSGGPAEITVKQLIPYRTREISASLPLKRITE
ncbi:MAG: hypothetical protein GXP33_11310, partial [Spirochaetes bacterium]|nr:hypothetical protein [Spirochaetota bacterium]